MKEALKSYYSEITNVKSWITPVIGILIGCYLIVTSLPDHSERQVQSLYWTAACIVAGILLSGVSVFFRFIPEKTITKVFTAAAVVVWSLFCMYLKIDGSTIVWGSMVMALSAFFVFVAEKDEKVHVAFLRMIDRISGIKVFKKTRYNILLFASLSLICWFLAFVPKFNLLYLTWGLLLTSLLVGRIVRILQGRS